MLGPKRGGGATVAQDASACRQLVCMVYNTSGLPTRLQYLGEGLGSEGDQASCFHPAISFHVTAGQFVVEEKR
jgi:hypothetical protein